MNPHVQAHEIDQVIRLRRTVKPQFMNGQQIDDETISELLALADWAPTHARTEPWRFIVFSGGQVKEFTRRHAELYRANAPATTFTQQKYDNLKGLGDNTSHIVIAWMKRVVSHKIPEIEEIAATSAAIQNLLLGAASRGISSFWSTGGMTHDPVFREEFGLGEEDRILGILYLGYSDEPLREGSRLIPLSEKTEWVR